VASEVLVGLQLVSVLAPSDLVASLQSSHMDSPQHGDQDAPLARPRHTLQRRKSGALSSEGPTHSEPLCAVILGIAQSE